MLYREAVREDAPAIARLHAESWLATFGNVLSDAYRATVFDDRAAVWQKRLSTTPDNQLVLVAEDGGELAGFACAYGGDDPELGSLLDNLHIRDGWQGRGLGKELTVRAADWCAEHYPQCGLYLLVLEQNARARAFYEALGATDAGAETWVPPGFLEAPSRRYAWPRDRVREIRRLAELPRDQA